MTQPLESCVAKTPPPRGERMLAILAPLLVLGVFLAAFAHYVGWPAWPVIDASERVAFSSMVAAALAVAVCFVRSCPRRLPFNLAATLACVLPVMTPMVRPGDWTYAGLAWWTVLIVVPVAMLATSLGRLRSRDGTVLASVVTLGVTAATGGLLMSTGSLKLGQAGLGLAAGVFLTFAIGLFVRPIGRSNGIPTLAFAVVAALLASGRLWSELPSYAGACVLAAPALAWIVRVPLVARRPAWQRVAIGLIVAAIPAGVAVGIEARKAYVASQAMGSDDYGY